MEKQIKMELMKSVDSIKNKIKKMKNNDHELNLSIDKMLRPATEPLKIIVNKQKPNKDHNLSMQSCASSAGSFESEFQNYYDADLSSAESPKNEIKDNLEASLDLNNFYDISSSSSLQPFTKQTQRNMDLENITYRKPYRTSSLSDMTNIEESRIFDTTIMSLPDTLHNNSQTLQDLNEKIKSLTNDLLSANQEIENLNSENFRLKADLDKSLKIIDSYKRINTFDRKSMTPTPRRKRKYSQNKILKSPAQITNPGTDDQSINNSPISKTNRPLDELEQNAINNDNLNILTIPSEKPMNLPACCTTFSNKILQKDNQQKTEINCDTPLLYASKEQIYSHEKGSKVGKRKIVIVADEQGYKIRETLQNLVGYEFIVTCYSKYGAPLKEVLAPAESELNKLNSNDFVIILGGINDKNPRELLFFLRQFLNNASKPNILVSEVPRNKYLNERKLNYEIKFICSEFKCVNYIEMNYSVMIPRRKYFPLYTSQLLLQELLRVDYKLKYEIYCKSLNDIPKHKKTYTENSTQTDMFDDPVKSSRDAGNTNHDNEILSIVEELKEANIIKE
ncbi:unnamed protein product [Parnassius mnemosyne]|uniref:Uncharacterized protein n=1 Tax=Parnassius mnemosyne TaxID=213953 RepID=A0AAV1KN15_9NEOP